MKIAISVSSLALGFFALLTYEAAPCSATFFKENNERLGIVTCEINAGLGRQISIPSDYKLVGERGGARTVLRFNLNTDDLSESIAIEHVIGTRLTAMDKESFKHDMQKAVVDNKNDTAILEQSREECAGVKTIRAVIAFNDAKDDNHRKVAYQEFYFAADTLIMIQYTVTLSDILSQDIAFDAVKTFAASNIRSIVFSR